MISSVQPAAPAATARSGQALAARPPDPRWLRIQHPRPTAWVRLFCLAQVGGTASFFRDWGALAPPELEICAVQYPGRENRLAEPAYTDMDQLVEALAAAIEPRIDRPVAFFGHSMGASVAYELVRRLLATGVVAPEQIVRLFVSGREAPQVVLDPAAEQPPEDLRSDREPYAHQLADGDLVELLSALGGTAPQVLADPELRELLLPTIRADYQLIETYQPVPAPPLPVPITVLTGDSDPYLDLAEATAWADVTSESFGLQTFPGDHFYLVPRMAAVVAAVSSLLPLPVSARKSSSAPRSSLEARIARSSLPSLNQFPEGA